MTLQNKATIVVLGSPLVALILILIGGGTGPEIAGLTVFALCIAVAFVSQWLLFIPSYLYQTEKYFDLSGSATYLVIAALALLLGADGDARSVVLVLMIAVWAIRLGSFLFLRVQRKGHDSRFAKIIPDFRVFLLTWTLQAMWISITVSCALVAITTTNKVPFDAWAWTGLALWLIGFGTETIADRQKQKFRADPVNAGRFITSGVWAFSRHPNYAGEILLWVGVALMAVPTLSGWQHLTLLSPVFVLYLLTKVSGVEMLERQNDATWGSDPDYQRYKANTPVLFPLGLSKGGDQGASCKISS